MRTLRSFVILVAAFFAAAVLAACATKAPGAASATLAPTVKAHTSGAPSPAASAQAMTPSAAGCATSTDSALPSSAITVCPSAGPVGSVVHVTITGCAPVGAGLSAEPAAALFFLGPASWLGTDGGGGANVPFSPKTGSEATATFTIPATYTGGTQDGGPYPQLSVAPGTAYEFITDPAGECHVPFTVTAS